MGMAIRRKIVDIQLCSTNVVSIGNRYASSVLRSSGRKPRNTAPSCVGIPVMYRANNPSAANAIAN
jgi:hypothetical protein